MRESDLERESDLYGQINKCHMSMRELSSISIILWHNVNTSKLFSRENYAENNNGKKKLGRGSLS